jgi:hypothetical protein
LEFHTDSQGYIVPEFHTDNQGYIVPEFHTNSQGYIVPEFHTDSQGYIVPFKGHIKSKLFPLCQMIITHQTVALVSNDYYTPISEKLITIDYLLA